MGPGQVEPDLGRPHAAPQHLQLRALRAGAGTSRTDAVTSPRSGHNGRSGVVTVARRPDPEEPAFAMATLFDTPTRQSATPPSRPLGGGWRQLINGRYLAMAVASIVVAYLALVPVSTMVYASLQSNFLGIGPSSWTFSNY